MNRFTTTLVTTLTLAFASHSAWGGSLVSYPEGYRGWHHVKSMVIHHDHPLAEPFEGIHHIYANPAAMKGYRGGHFPDGAVIVFDLLAAPAAAGATTEGARKLIGVMVRDRSRYGGTGGWGFEGFEGDSHDRRLVGGDATTACFTCHTDVGDHEYVFSRYRK